jgi:signal transduction histidine kinase
VGPLSQRQLYFATKALESNDRGLQVIEELLNVAKADAGRLVLNLTTFSVAELIQGVVSEQRDAIAAAQLELEVVLPGKDIDLTADHDKLYMAIGNLLDNARKYTPPGGNITLKVIQRARSVRFSVSDTGPGVPPDDIPHIFDRFARSASPHVQHIEGTGLGLYLVRSVAELHRGRVKVKNHSKKGATFVMIIPKRRPLLHDAPRSAS